MPSVDDIVKAVTDSLAIAFSAAALIGTAVLILLTFIDGVKKLRKF